MPTYAELVASARASVSEIQPSELEDGLGQLIVIDIREADEHQSGTIPGSRLIPRGILESVIESRVPDRSRDIVLFCSGGARSALAASSLSAMGYERVRSMAGGFNRWKDEGRGWVPPAGLSPEQRTRYQRHLLLPEVGDEGQGRLLDSSVLVVGAGGLGSPAAMYLAAAGVGKIGLVDFDRVDASNLQRQILHNVDRIGMAKVESGRETLAALNPDVKVVAQEERLTAANVLDVLSGYDVVVEGQAAVFDPYEGPCYRCLFPLPPPPELAPSCAEAGVLGVLPGIIGSIQAMETIKVLLGIGETLAGRLLIYDGMEEDFQTVKVRRSPDCAACSDPDRPPRLIDYDLSCTPAGRVERS